MSIPPAYSGREQTLVKHIFLKAYLQRLAYKIGYHNGGVINYVDGFAGPWQHQTTDLSDTSPYIAMSELAAARDGLFQAGRPELYIRCIFNELDRQAVQLLTQRLPKRDGFEVCVLEGSFEDNLPGILSFVRVRQRAFNFFFIDPTGWTGFGMNTIAPLLGQPRSEVMINFMTKDIKRFVDDDTPKTRASFDDLFGDQNYRDQWQNLFEQDREDAIVEAYCERVRRTGGFSYVTSGVVLHPTDQRTHFHLVYATRHPEGLRVFRDVECRAMKEQEQARAQAQQNKRMQQHHGQQELFGAELLADHSHYQRLRERYVQRAKEAVLARLQSQRRVLFDDLELLALHTPMTWTADVKNWIADWQRAGQVNVEGLPPRARVPQRGEGHYILWIR